MRKKILALTMAASVLALAACGDKGDEALVTSKAGDVTQNELYEKMKESAGEQTLQLIVIEKVLDDKYDVTDKEVDAEFDKFKEQLGESFEQTIAQEGHTPESFKDFVRFNLLQEKALIEGVEVTDEQVKQRIEEKNTELNARHVLLALDDEETALKVKKQLEDGADFAEVAKEFSIEPVAKESGGDLGWFKLGMMVPEFWEAAYNLELNKISEPVTTEHGLHIIEVTEKREVEEGKVTDKDKEQIRKEIALEQADPESFVDKISKLMEDANVTVKDADLKSALDMFMKVEEKEADPAEDTKEEK